MKEKENTNKVSAKNIPIEEKQKIIAVVKEAIRNGEITSAHFFNHKTTTNEKRGQL